MTHLSKYKAKVLSQLIFLHDKYIFWNSKRNVLISFQQYADKLVILGDPIGEKRELSNAIEEFQKISDLHGFTPVFYQVSDDILPLLYGSGYAFFKLGEEAFVNLKTFSLSENNMKDLRSLRNKFIREDYQVDMSIHLFQMSY